MGRSYLSGKLFVNLVGEGRKLNQTRGKLNIQLDLVLKD